MKNNNKNIIVASIEFYFKGKRYTAETIIDLDYLLETSRENHDRLALIYSRLAKEGNIDTYSYEYEVMQEETIQFSQATGVAANYCENGVFSMGDFEKAWHENIALNHIKSIAKQHLAIDDLSQHTDLKTALTEAYLLGKSKSDNSKN